MGVESPFIFTAKHNQTFIEGVFRDAMGSGERIIRGLSVGPQAGFTFAPRKVEVEHGVTPTRLGVLEGEYPVEVELENAQAGKESVRAKYVIGCDGAHSWTRSQLGIDMVGDNSGTSLQIVSTRS
jgi:hypothetical protein